MMMMNQRLMTNANWKDFYGDVKEAIPPNAPEPRGRSVHITSSIMLIMLESCDKMITYRYFDLAL